ncbi:hypothetical protein [Geotoga petraea]|nr:hypothetical protein [Geotoga petraea]
MFYNSGFWLIVVGKIKNKVFKKQKTKLPKYQYTVFFSLDKKKYNYV